MHLHAGYDLLVSCPDEFALVHDDCSDVWAVQIHQVIILHVPAPYAPMATPFAIGLSVCGQARPAINRMHIFRNIYFGIIRNNPKYPK